MLYSLFMDSDEVLRIGELSKRSGVSPELLRAWERRYGAPSSRALGRRPAPLRARGRRARACHAPAPRRPGRRRGGGTRVAGGGRRRSGTDGAPPRGGAGRSRRRARPGTTSRGRRRSSTGCSPWRPWTRCSARSSCRICASSESAGCAVTPPSHRSTSPPASCAGDCSAWRAAGVSGSGRRRCSRACQGAARPRPDRVRPGAALAGLARRLSRHRFADRDGRGGHPPARSEPRGPDRRQQRARAAGLAAAAGARRPHRLALGGAAAANGALEGSDALACPATRSPRRRGSRRSFRAASEPL